MSIQISNKTEVLTTLKNSSYQTVYYPNVDQYKVEDLDTSICVLVKC